MTSPVRAGSYPSSSATSRRCRPWTPPSALAAANATSKPTFIWRPSSLEVPVKGAAMPKSTSVSVTPGVGGGSGAAGTAGCGLTEFARWAAAESPCAMRRMAPRASAPPAPTAASTKRSHRTRRPGPRSFRMREKGAVGATVLGPEPTAAFVSSVGERRGPEPACAWGPLPGGRGLAVEPDASAWRAIPDGCFTEVETTGPASWGGGVSPVPGCAMGGMTVPCAGVRRAAAVPPLGVPHRGWEPCRGVGVPGSGLVPVTRMPAGGVGVRVFGVPAVPRGGVGVRPGARAKAAASAGAADLRPPGSSAFSSWRSSSRTSALQGS